MDEVDGMSGRRERVAGWLGRYGLVLAACLPALLLCRASFMGDTLYYTDAILLHVHGGDYRIPETGPNYQFWEFGHLLWRPLGWAVWRATEPLARSLAGGDERGSVTVVLIGLNWLSIVASALLVRATAARFCRRAWPANLLGVAVVFTHGVLDYGHSGCSYVPGLALLLAGFYLLLSDREPWRAPWWRASAFAGAALAFAVCLWVPYVLALPMALAAPLLLVGRDRRQLRRVLLASAVLAACTGAIYFSVMGWLGIGTLAEFREWMSGASHGLQRRQSVAAVAFGLARSFLNMGDDGIVFKRFLVGDPLNPVSIYDLLRLSLWKIAAFYAFAAAVLLALAPSPFGRRLLLLLAVAAAPVFAFALFFQATSYERYMPLYPALLLAAACALDGERAWPWLKGLKVLIAGFLVTLVLTNAAALAKFRIDRRQEQLAARVRELQPRLKPQSRIFVVKDELAMFATDHPLHPLNREFRLQFFINSFVSLDKPETPRWRADVSAAVLSVWREGGDAWLARRLLAERPLPEWGWVEGADPRVRWADIHSFFARLETGPESVGGHDGFVLLRPTPENRGLLEAHAREAQPAH